MSNERTQWLMKRVVSREYFVRLACGGRQGFLVGSALTLGWLLTHRLGGLMVEPRPAVVAGILLFSGAAWAMLTGRQLSIQDASRLVDTRIGTKELFLTIAQSEHTGFWPVVDAQAEEQAQQIQPKQVVPFHWQRGAGTLLGVIALIALGYVFLPRLDPFGKAQQRTKLAQQEQRLVEMKKTTAIRAEQIARSHETESRLDKALVALEKTFQEAKPKERELNLEKLAIHQKEFGEMWRQKSLELPRDNFERAAQSFSRDRKSEEWREQLKKGDFRGLNKELSEVREQLKKLATLPESAEKRALQEQIAQRLHAAAEAAKQGTSSPQLNAALARALEQLEQSKTGKFSQEAIQDAMESLDLSGKELEQLAREMGERKKIEEALQAIQMAKQLAGEQQLDGQLMQGKGIGGYVELFAEKMKELNEGGGGRGSGSGMGEGIGNGARRPENDAAQTGFKPEKSLSALSGGKLLMEWKTSEVGPSDARVEDYRESLREVKQGVSEAIISEQVPPGYRSAIQKYFDTLPEK